MSPVQCGYDSMCCQGDAGTQGYSANALDEHDLHLAREAKLCRARHSLVTLLEQQERSKATLLFILEDLDSLGTGQLANEQTELQSKHQGDESTSRGPSHTRTLLSPHLTKRTKEVFKEVVVVEVPSIAAHSNLQVQNTGDECTGRVLSQTGTLLGIHQIKHAKEALDETAVEVPSAAANHNPQASSPPSALGQEEDVTIVVDSQAELCATIAGDMQVVAFATPSADMQGAACATPYADVHAVVHASVSELSVSSITSSILPRRSAIRRMSTQGTTDIIMGVRRSLQRNAYQEWEFWGRTRQTCKVVVRSACFRYVVLTVTLMNALCLGIEAQWSLDPLMRDKWPRTVDASFAMFFIIEIIFRLTSADWRSFVKSWFVLDSLLVIVDVARGVVLLSHREQEDMQAVMMALRTFRLLRLVRVLRLLHSLKQVLLLLYGVFTSGSTVMSTFTILALLLYIWAILGVELITRNPDLNADPEAARIVEKHFSSVQSSLLTLVQFVSMDAMAAIYSPLIKKEPYLAVYFLSVFFSVSLLLVNLITSVLIRATLENAECDKMVKRQALHDELKQWLPELEEMFESLDTQQSGALTQSEFDQFPMELIPKEFWVPFFVTSMQDIFEMLDIDCSGILTKQEFVHGISALFLVGTPLEQIRSMSLAKIAVRQMHKLERPV